MDLKDFVKETLVQITEGVKEAQNECKDLGGLVNPMLETPISNEEKFEIRSKYYPATSVNFKVGLTESDSTGAKKGIGVFLGKISAGAESKKDTEIQSVTSVEFSVTVVFPYISRDGKHITVADAFIRG
nr:hypothetical protein [uncultured Bacteroides sp.]